MTTRALAVLSLLLALGAAGCTTATPELYVSGVCAQADDNADKCTTPAGKCDLYLTGFAYMFADVDFGAGPVTNSLDFFLQVDNQGVPNPSTDPAVGHVNTRDAIIDTVKVAYEAPGYALTAVEYPSFGPKVPAGGTATTWVTLIPRSTSAQLLALAPPGEVDLVAIVKLGGKLTDGSAFETVGYRVAVRYFPATFTPGPCTTAGDVRFYCPHAGQTSGTKCGAP
jgi:hypothetical protein